MSILKAENLIKMYGQEPNIVKALFNSVRSLSQVLFII